MTTKHEHEKNKVALGRSISPTKKCLNFSHQGDAVVDVKDLRLGPVKLIHLVEVPVDVGHLGVVENFLKNPALEHFYRNDSMTDCFALLQRIKRQ